MPEELEPLPAPPVNISKTPTDELKNTPITSNNADSVTRELQKREGKVMIMIASTERDKHAQYVSVNGRSYLIPRDKWFAVPKSVVHVLRNAITTEIMVKSDPTKDDKSSVVKSNVSRFSMSEKPVVEPPVATGKQPVK